MRGASVRGARRLTGAGVLSQSVEHGEQAQRSHGGPLITFIEKSPGFPVSPHRPSETRGASLSRNFQSLGNCTTKATPTGLG